MKKLDALSGSHLKAPPWFQPTYSPSAMQWMMNALQHQKYHIIDQQERHSMMQRMSITGRYRKEVHESAKAIYDPEVVDWLCKQPPVPTAEEMRVLDREAAIKKHVEEIRKRADKLAEDTNYKEALAAQCTN